MSWAEAALVVYPGGVVVPHLPPGRTMIAIPDSADLWRLLYATRKQIVGVAHLHPGRGPNARAPSTEDRTTFDAVERGLGRKLSWWIVCAEGATLYRYARNDDGEEGYEATILDPEPAWCGILRLLGENGNGGGER